MDKNTLIEVINRDPGRVGYKIPDLNVRRAFNSREVKEIPFGELKALSYTSGGMYILTHYLVMKNDEAIKEILGDVEPEYYYSEQDIINLMQHGSLDAFLDCLDFAPRGVLELVKSIAVSLPLDNMSKREAILDKLNFDVTQAINIKNTKFDGEVEEEENAPSGRRVAIAAKPEAAEGRRTAPKKYNVISE